MKQQTTSYYFSKVTLYWYASLILLVIIPVFVHWNGLFGPFLLDDFGNLSNLEKYNTIAKYTWYNLLADAQAGGSGRPLSLLSFIATASAWPENPLPFKLVNYLLHSINSIFVFILAYQICKILGNSRNLSLSIALVTGLIWAIHPIQQSTIFYVVQRMTQLSAFFVLLGVNYYIYHRNKFHLTNKNNFLPLSIIYSICLLLAVLSKENGLLLCIFVILCEGFLFSKNITQWMSWIRWGAIFSILPIVLFSIYVISIWDVINLGYQWRDFDLYERLLTQLNVVSSYISFIFVPTLSESTLFHDDFEISRSLFNPSTFISFLFIISLITLAYLSRTKKPIIFFGIIWFFIGHLMESTLLPLELYFEHRNYLASFGLFFTAVYMATHIPSKIKKITYSLLIIYFLLIMWLSQVNSIIWGDEDKLINVWANERKYSVRANQNMALYWHKLNNGHMVFKTFHEAGKLMPLNLGIRIQELQYACDLGYVDKSFVDEITSIASYGKYDHTVTQSLMHVVSLYKTGNCNSLQFKELLKIAEGLQANPKFKNPLNQSNINFVIGVLYSSKGDLDNSIKYMDVAFDFYNDPNIAILQAGWLASAGLYKDALNYVEKAKLAIDNLGVLKYKDYSEVIKFKKQITRDMYE